MKVSMQTTIHAKEIKSKEKRYISFRRPKWPLETKEIIKEMYGLKKQILSIGTYSEIAKTNFSTTISN